MAINVRFNIVNARINAEKNWRKSADNNRHNLGMNEIFRLKCLLYFTLDMWHLRFMIITMGEKSSPSFLDVRRWNCIYFAI
jgi:hypothetical protein